MCLKTEIQCEYSNSISLAPARARRPTLFCGTVWMNYSSHTTCHFPGRNLFPLVLGKSRLGDYLPKNTISKYSTLHLLTSRASLLEMHYLQESLVWKGIKANCIGLANMAWIRSREQESVMQFLQPDYEGALPLWMIMLALQCFQFFLLLLMAVFHHGKKEKNVLYFHLYKRAPHNSSRAAKDAESNKIQQPF